MHFSSEAGTRVEKGMERGLLLNSTQDVVLRLLPPFILQEAHVDEAVGIMREIFREVG